MDINFLPTPGDAPTLAVSLEELRFVPGGIEERIAWVQNAGFGGVEFLATGEAASGIHAPSVDASDRARLHDVLDGLHLVVQAPHQQTWDVTLVSPVAAGGRVSLLELWSVCRFAGAVGGGAETGPPLVLVRTGTPPLGVGQTRVLEFLRESLMALDRMAGDHNARIGLTARDVLENPYEWEFALDGLQNTGIAFDAVHALDRGASAEDCAGLLRRFAPALAYVRMGAGENRAFFAETLRQAGYANVLCVALAESGDRALSTGDVLCRDWKNALHGIGGSEETAAS